MEFGFSGAGEGQLDEPAGIAIDAEGDVWVADSVNEARSTLAARIRGRLPQLQGNIATRAHAISDPRDVADPAYPERLDAVLRRYVAGNAIFGDFVSAEAERAGVPNTALRHLFAEQAALGDRLLAAVSEEHAREASERPSAYFAAERNVSSTAAALGVDRRTVRNRLGAIEERLGRPLKGSMAELEIALRLAD